MTNQQLRDLLAEIVEFGHAIESPDAAGNEHWTPEYRSLVERVHAAITGTDEPPAELCIMCGRPYHEHEPMVLTPGQFDARTGIVCPSVNRGGSHDL